MRRLTFLLRPSWVILAAVVVAFAYLCFTVLAPWQLGKNTRTSHRNELIADSVRAEPVDAATVFDGRDAAHEWRRITASGAYVPNSTVLVRLRHLDGNPAYSVLGAFKLDDGRIVLIDRGLIAAANGTSTPPIPDPPAGPQHLEGRLRAAEGVIPGKDPSVQDGFRQVYSIDLAQEMTVLELPLTALPDKGYLQLEKGQPGAFTPDPLPQLDAGPYLSYGLQWLAFGIMAPLGLGYFVFAEIRERRKEKAAATPQPTGPDPEPQDPQADTQPTRQNTQARLADRYGRGR
ncbi:SURF1 family protein [Nocardia panacis]|uniref:SURF1-like protein n=1 Tax=Nocardia panacis TaxID=2340916 RepID=A0A3A4K4W6_9NOCA|nr:SURF1 family cytochrome oxidase biogenesis protein [Nocardia panacis]RJO69324.1 SURF1 family protein [Nocardia panacis]